MVRIQFSLVACAASSAFSLKPEVECQKVDRSPASVDPGPDCRERQDKYPYVSCGKNTRPCWVDERSELSASQTCVLGAASRSSGAPGPPIFVGTEPGSKAFDRTSGHSLATANASKTLCRFESEYAAEPSQRRRFHSRSYKLASPPPCIPELSYTSLSGLVINAVRTYGASKLMTNTCGRPSAVSIR
jgi:hypothetical protein